MFKSRLSYNTQCYIAIYCISLHSRVSLKYITNMVWPLGQTSLLMNIHQHSEPGRGSRCGCHVTLYVNGPIEEGTFIKQLTCTHTRDEIVVDSAGGNYRQAERIHTFTRN